MSTDPLSRSGPGSRAIAFLGMLAVALVGLPPVRGTDYFVDPNGDDRNSGIEPAAAWRSVDRVNAVRLLPGDRVSFAGGSTFSGNLQLTAEDAGTAAAPVTIGSFGPGRATLAAGRATGITVENAGGIVLENLVIRGAGRTNNSGYGVRCDHTLTNAPRLAHLTLTNLDVHGFGIFGVLVAGDHAGFEHVRVSHCRLHDNLRGGMEIAGRLPWDARTHAHADVRVDHCQAFDNTGDPDYLKNHSGSGIVLYQVDGGVMEHCQAWNNGALCRSAGGGGVGLWACASRRVVLQYCESFGNRTSSADGGGFDLDGGCEDCVLQYNFSHDNDGPGLMVYSYPYASHRDSGSIVRFNVSANDSRKGSRYAGLWVRTDGPPLTGVEIYHNTVVIGPWTEQAALVHGREVEARIRNNLFVGTGSARPLRVEAPSERLRFENNLYWNDAGTFRLNWGENEYATLDAWRAAAGQESVAGNPTGLFVDPGLDLERTRPPIDGFQGAASLRRFTPRSGSPALGAGLDLRRRFGTDIGEKDLLGTPLAGPFPIGGIAAPPIR